MKKGLIYILIAIVILAVVILFFSIKKTTCTYEGEEYKKGESFPASDGCNTCFCDKKNGEGKVSCSIIEVCPNDEEKCIESGGEWRSAGMIGNFICIQSYSDGGKECNSSSECQGKCVVADAENPEPYCTSDNDPFGCFSTIEEFNENGAIVCRD